MYCLQPNNSFITQLSQRIWQRKQEGKIHKVTRWEEDEKRRSDLEDMRKEDARRQGTKQTEHSRKENLRREGRGLGMWKSLYVV